MHVESELLAGLRVFRVALTDAEQKLITAADLLGDRATGLATQQAEQRALERFEQIAQALEQTASAANAPSSGGQGGDGGGGAKRPLFDLFEVKLLRTLQADLNERTQAFQKRPDGEELAARQRAADELSAEQGRLAELVEELLTRDNDSEDADE
jgi:phosphoglycerate-specific signal transduction histidine kinase